MKNIFVILILLSTINLYSQQNIFGVPQNSATTQSKMDLASKNINQAYVAYFEGNIEKAKYFVDQSQKHGFKSGDFYFLLGAYMYKTDELKAAKRYWKISHKEGGCWECKQYLEKLKNNEPIDSLILEKVRLYVSGLKK
ncbi:hypothetical protein [Hyunsoonleella rubra]|uniref:Sel1 repeat family protein n=1 Tax=Hyunsoonleella rubra TaxID=1737062 RepID=A0ABW5TBX5_9FLAO